MSEDNTKRELRYDAEAISLKLHAVRFRELLDRSRGFAKSMVCLSVMERFPHGCCKPASMLLARYLSSTLGVPHAAIELCANGERLGQSHAWLEVNQIGVDITCDQFADSPDRVIVAEQSPWHSLFHGRRLYPYCDFMHMNAQYRQDVERLFAHIVGSETAKRSPEEPQPRQ